MATSAMTDSNSYLADVPQEHVFWCCDGQILKNLKELRDAFAVMSEDTFAYHVNAAKNDFHNWVRDIIKDEVLANNMLKATSTTAGVRIVTEGIAFLSGRPASAPAKKETRRKPTRR
jgi:hypothetical protein